MLLNARNPLIFADVPDPDVIRIDRDGKPIYYMVSTTMHITPGVPVMRSYDLVHWETVSYVYDILGDSDRFALKNGQQDYANGSWASSIRYDEITERFFVAFTCQSTAKTYFFSTENIEEGRWHRTEIDYAKCYDNSMYFEGDKKYIIYSRVSDMEVTRDNGTVEKLPYSSCCLCEMFVDSKTYDVHLGEEKVLIPYTNYENPPEGLWGEGYHAYKINGYYYIFMIQVQLPQRQETVWRSKDLLNGPWEIRKVFTGDMITLDGEPYMPFTGIAQGGIIQNEFGEWYALLFQDYGSVGRIPILIPMRWDEDGWCVIGNGGKSADIEVSVNASRVGRDFVVADDEFENAEKHFMISDTCTDEITAGLTCEQLERLAQSGGLAEAVDRNEYGYNGSQLQLVWQWNHSPNNNLWSLTERESWLRLKGGIISDSIVRCRNVLTQRTFGPASSADTLLDYSGLKDGDIAGISAFQNQYGFVGVKRECDKYYLIMHRATQKDDAEGVTIEKKLLIQDSKRIYLRVECDFRELKDEASFYYSLDNESWTKIGDELHMKYDWPHFVGYRFGLFLLPTQKIGGFADFDYYHISNEICSNAEWENLI